MTVPGLQAVAQLFTERLLNSAVEGIVLAGLVWLLFRVIRQNSETRFAIWLSVLLAIAALPFLSWSGFGASHPGVLPAKITLSSSWAFYLFAVWGIGAGLLLLRVSIGLWRVHQIRRNCSELDLSIVDPAIGGVFRDFGSRRRVKLCLSDEVAVPAAIGFFRPAIVFPASLLPQLTTEEIQVILLHELAHLRRRDDWTNLAQKIVKAVFFFHPAVWWIESRLILEREMACDDMVLSQTASPRAYASSLISFAEKLQNARALALAQALVSRMRDMSLRVAQILEARRPGRGGVWKPVLALGGGMLALILGAAPYAPRVVAFEKQSNLGSEHHSQTTRATAEIRTSRTNTSNVSAGATPAPQARVIPASFNSRSTSVHRRLKSTPPRKPMFMRASAVPQELPPQEMFFIVQTTQYDASGAGVWTLCVWRVGGENRAEQQLESAIVLSLI